MMASSCESRAELGGDQQLEKVMRVVERGYVVYLVIKPCAGVGVFVQAYLGMEDRVIKSVGVLIKE